MLLKKVLLLSAVVLTVACGGGGSSSKPTVSEADLESDNAQVLTLQKNLQHAGCGFTNRFQTLSCPYMSSASDADKALDALIVGVEGYIKKYDGKIVKSSVYGDGEVKNLATFKTLVATARGYQPTIKAQVAEQNAKVAAEAEAKAKEAKAKEDKLKEEKAKEEAAKASAAISDSETK